MKTLIIIAIAILLMACEKDEYLQRYSLDADKDIYVVIDGIKTSLHEKVGFETFDGAVQFGVVGKCKFTITAEKNQLTFDVVDIMTINTLFADGYCAVRK